MKEIYRTEKTYGEPKRIRRPLIGKTVERAIPSRARRSRLPCLFCEKYLTVKVTVSQGAIGRKREEAERQAEACMVYREK